MEVRDSTNPATEMDNNSFIQVVSLSLLVPCEYFNYMMIKITNIYDKLISNDSIARADGQYYDTVLLRNVLVLKVAEKHFLPLKLSQEF